MAETYRVFKRRPWKRNKSWPQGWEPFGGARKRTIEHGLTYAEALRTCENRNAGKVRAPGQEFYEFERE